MFDGDVDVVMKFEEGVVEVVVGVVGDDVMMVE